MAAESIVWVLADAADAARFLSEARPGPVLPLAPSVTAALRDAAVERLDPLASYTDWAQARTVVAVRRARIRLLKAVEELSGRKAINREIALDHFLRAAHTAYRLWFTLGAQGPWMIPAGTGWKRCEKRREAYEALLDHMLLPLVAGQEAALQVRLPPFVGVYRALRDRILRYACRGRAVVVSGARKGMFGLLEAVAAQPRPTRILVVQTGGDGWRDYLRLIRAAVRALCGQRFLDVNLVVPPAPANLDVAYRLVRSVDDAVIEPAFRRHAGFLARRLGQAVGGYFDASRIVAAARPDHFVTVDASRLADWALAEAGGEAGVMRWGFSRNTHVMATTAMAEDACAGYFRARHPEGMVDRYLCWSPHGAAAARAYAPEAVVGTIEPIAAVPVAAHENGDVRPRRRVLVADSYAVIWFPHCWAFQTSDEFMASLKQLIDVLEPMPDVDLMIRAKRKRELDEPDYRRLLPARENIAAKIRDVPFHQELAQCDVLVAFRASTIEEALHARRPVLLWGGSARYRYLPARTVPPTPSDRAPIYAADDAAALARMLPAILAAHAGKPLTDAEIAPHVWPAGTQSVEDVARRMAAPRIAAGTIGNVESGAVISVSGPTARQSPRRRLGDRSR